MTSALDLEMSSITGVVTDSIIVNKYYIRHAHYTATRFRAAKTFKIKPVHFFKRNRTKLYIHFIVETVKLVHFF